MRTRGHFLARVWFHFEAQECFEREKMDEVSSSEKSSHAEDDESEQDFKKA
jgi:hypothetical protein